MIRSLLRGFPALSLPTLSLAALILPMLILLAATTPGSAQTAPSSSPQLRDIAFVTCEDAQAMSPDARKALVLQIAHAAARFYQSTVPDSEEAGQQIGWLIRSGCTIAPHAYLSTVVARAVRVMGGGVEPPLRQPLDMDQAMFVSCAGAQKLSPDQRWEIGRFIGTEAAAHYRLTPTSEWTPTYIAALVHNDCMMYPDAYFLSIVGRAVQAMSTQVDEAGKPLAKTQ